MRLIRFFGTPVSRVPAAAGAGTGTAAAPADGQSQGVFITPQSITTFPVASAVVSGFSAAYKSLVPSAHDSPFPTAISALLVGVFLYFVSERAKDASVPLWPWYMRFFIALVNTVYLYTASIGISSVASSALTPAPPGPV